MADGTIVDVVYTFGLDGCYTRVVSAESDHQWYFVKDSMHISVGRILWRLGVTAVCVPERQVMDAVRP